MSVPRILLLLPWAPGASHAGNIFIREFTRHYPPSRLCGFGIEFGYPSQPRRRNFEGIPFLCAKHPPEFGITKLGRFVDHLHTLAIHFHIKYVRAPILAKQAISFGREQGVELVCAMLNQHATSLYMTRLVAEGLQVPLVSMVMDPPERFVLDHPMSGPAKRVVQSSLQQALVKTLRASIRCGVASEGMQIEYKQQYGFDSIVLIHGLDPDLGHSPVTKLNRPDQLVIGFAGSLYAEREWQALLSALSEVGWCIEGRQVIIRLLSGTLNLKTKDKVCVEYLGWRSLEETLVKLSQADLNYLPYWFDEAYRPAVRMSFPNKLSTYVAAGRPILYHGPAEATAAQFFQRFPVGLCCSSLEASEILASLKRLVLDQELYARAAEQTRAAMENELNSVIFLRRFAALLGISEAELFRKST